MGDLSRLRGQPVRARARDRVVPRRLVEAASAAGPRDRPDRLRWLAALPSLVDCIASRWELVLGEPYLPGGQCAWVAPARDPAGRELALKVGWRHWEAEHEAQALESWAGDGAVHCFASETRERTTVLLLERCTPGRRLTEVLPEADRDAVIAGLLRRLWTCRPADGHPFAALEQMCDRWAQSAEDRLERGVDGAEHDPGLVGYGIALLRELPRSADRAVLLGTDLHADNVLAAEREPWLVVDPKPFVGDPAYDTVQHMLNCPERLNLDPVSLARRMAELLELDPERVRLWLLARCAQESLDRPALGDVARRLTAAT